MNELFKDKEHLVRMAGLFAAGFLLFMVARSVFVPKTFGDYGHFRAAALDEMREQQLRYAGRAACADCHSDIVEARKGSKHEAIGCETCHGPLAKHASDPSSQKASKPDPEKVCLTCHLANAGRPQHFPQITPKQHTDESPCTNCHLPHHPEIS